MNKDKKTEEKKLRDLTPQKDAKGGMHPGGSDPDSPKAGLPGPKPTIKNVKGYTK